MISTLRLAYLPHLPSFAESLRPRVPLRARLIAPLDRLYRDYLRITAGWSVAHLLEVPAVSVDSRADVVRQKPWSSVPAALLFVDGRWEVA